jgi:hypothetical protein
MKGRRRISEWAGTLKCPATTVHGSGCRKRGVTTLKVMVYDEFSRGSFRWLGFVTAKVREEFCSSAAG